jgi:hypothetical protein
MLLIDETIKKIKLIKLINLTKKQIFMLSTVSILIIGLCSRINVHSGIFVGIFMSILFVAYMHSLFNVQNENVDTTHKLKKESIYPKSHIITKYDDVSDCIFEIQDLYVYSPQIYEELISSINNFFILYEDTLKFPSKSGINFKMAQNMITKIMNLMHSFIYNVSSHVLIDKINLYSKKINDLLNSYLLKIYYAYKQQLDDNNINVNTQLININDPQPYTKLSIIGKQFQFYA